jgi:hypothetical protein
MLSDEEFKTHFRLDRKSVEQLAVMLGEDLTFSTGRGRPFTPVQQVCTALNYYAGASYQRISPLVGGVSQTAAFNAIRRVTEALTRRKAQHIRLPDSEEMEATAQRMAVQFGLPPKFAFSVDTVAVRFEEAPRGLPEGKHAQMYLNRKQFHAINCQLVANDRFIYDLDCAWHGRAPDAKVWIHSSAKLRIEQQKRFLLAGDAAYPLSENLVRPYSGAEAAADPSKVEFNGRLGGLCKAMSGNVADCWTRRFPCLSAMRNKLLFAQKVIIATAILHNLAVTWEDPLPENPPPAADTADEVELDDEEGDDEEDAALLLMEKTNETAARVAGMRLRDQLRECIEPL